MSEIRRIQEAELEIKKQESWGRIGREFVGVSSDRYRKHRFVETQRTIRKRKKKTEKKNKKKLMTVRHERFPPAGSEAA